jgi:hypothetical protein
MRLLFVEVVCMNRLMVMTMMTPVAREAKEEAPMERKEEVMTTPVAREAKEEAPMERKEGMMMTPVAREAKVARKEVMMTMTMMIMVPKSLQSVKTLQVLPLRVSSTLLTTPVSLAADMERF